MLYRLGRVMQVIGLVMLPIAIVANLAPERAVSLWTSLTWSAIGIGIFFLGWMLQQAGRRR
jgi:uncharacterized membrane protein YGL010W